MATINPQAIVVTGNGLTPVYTIVNASDTLVNNGNSFLHVKNGNAGNCTVTITATTSCSQGTLHDAVAIVPLTTGDRMIGPFPINRFGSAPVVTYSVQATVTAGLFALSS